MSPCPSTRTNKLTDIVQLSVYLYHNRIDLMDANQESYQLLNINLTFKLRNVISASMMITGRYPKTFACFLENDLQHKK